MKITSRRFERAAVQPEDEPRAPGPDVMFLGRSNVGKSSLINRLLGTKDLARTSSRPGRTRTVNFYRVNDALHFVDLPGYGWAGVSRSERRSWGPLVEGVLERRRERIAMVVMLLDARHRPTELDRTMKEWLDHRQLPYLIVATKADKLSGNGRAKAERVLQEGIGESPVTGPPVLASARTGLGLREIWGHLDRALGVRA